MGSLNVFDGDGWKPVGACVQYNNDVDKIYPVGSIYMSVNDTDPGILFGGTWQRIKDMFLLAAGDSYAAGATGGEATHTLTVNEMPSHQHDRIDYVGNDGWTIGDNTGLGGTQTDTYSYKFAGTQVISTAISHFSTSQAGGSQAHNNMPPYLAVYVWKRTA